LMEFDSWLPDIINRMYDADMLIITADHACDPTTPGTDHTRESVPLLVYGALVRRGVNLNTRETFSDIAATVLDYLGVSGNVQGKSFLKEVLLSYGGANE